MENFYIDDYALSRDELENLKTEFGWDRTAKLMQNAVTTTSINKIALDRDIANSIDTSMSNKLDTWPITDQKKSGRCWLFAGLNFLKQSMIGDFSLEGFELSQCYMQFYDKLEKSNWFLTSMIELADRELDDRTVTYLLDHPAEDGGQWDMFVSLVLKYGVVPKYAMPETESSSNSDAMNTILSTLLRRSARRLRDAVAAGEDAQALKKEIMKDIYKLLCIHLGTPPAKFIWQWQDKDKKFSRAGEMTPLEFAAKYIKADLTQYVCVVNDPRETSPFGNLFTVDKLGNVVGGREIRYLNAEAGELKELVKKAILDGRVVWFGCDVSQQYDSNSGIWDARILDYEGVYGTRLDMTKAERMVLRESAMTHAMVFTGIDIVDERIRRYRVENSWGDDRSDKGFDTMNDSWFSEYVFEVAVPISDLPEELKASLSTEPIVLPIWDPMGALA